MSHTADIPEHDPWDEREAYLAEGHDELEVEAEIVVDADTGSDPDTSEHEGNADG